MCGIIGILGQKQVAGSLIEALKRLEYRGYDSAGIATLDDGQLGRRRAAGKLINLVKCLQDNPLSGPIGIGHTRWATHGQPTHDNAHPHSSLKVAVVHNGIIENFKELRQELSAKGYNFQSSTDTETVVALVTDLMDQGLEPVAAVRRALPRLHGAYALAFLFAGYEDLLIGARQGAPLAVGFGVGEMYLGSDAIALAPFTDSIAYLEDGDWVILSRQGAQFFDTENRPVQRARVGSISDTFLVSRGNYRHFMAKEIHEQPEVVARTLAHYIDMAEGVVRLPFELGVDVKKLDRISISACGTGYLAGLVGKYWIEHFARLPVDIEVASEFRYREPPMQPDGLMVVISQSGETADTLAALRYAKAYGQRAIALVNVTTSTIARESDIIAPTLAGPEIGVASTKAFTCQLVVLACLAIAFARLRGKMDEAQEKQLVRELIAIPGLMTGALAVEPGIKQLSRQLAKANDVIYLGRGVNYPLALEAALKLKELSYIHAEGYAAGELKHGPIALVDENLPVIVISPTDLHYEKTVSNMQEVAARGGKIIFLGDAEGAKATGLVLENSILLPPMAPNFAVMVYAIPIQMIAYHTALAMGKDADQPRNLAKSVTVE